jgi:regulator of protease activity HflC (stomatin/prohibitin superfamily)
MPIIPMIYFLRDGEQLLIEALTERRTVNGPARVVTPAFSRVQRRKATTLAATEYLHLRDNLTGAQRTEIGPKLVFLAPNEEVVNGGHGITLQRNQYLLIVDQTSGARRIARGEDVLYLQPTDSAPDGVQNGHDIDENSALLIQDLTSGQYELITTPQVFIPTAAQTVVETRQRIMLKSNQFMRIIDQRSGVVRVERGEQALFLGVYDQILEAVRDGYIIDEHNAALVRDTDSGEYELITTPQVFIPAAKQFVAEIRKRIRLEDHETMVIKDKDGKYHYRRGTDAERAFFLQPFQEIVEFRWSSGLTKDKRELKLTRIDSRSQYMWYDFEVRTQDNVELVIGITFFWQILDVAHMIQTTDDTTGNVCAHARSRIIQSVSRTTLERFLAEFNTVVGGAVLDPTDAFYDERGVRLLAVEVRYILCKDAGTQKILQDIIQETTNRINRVQKQASENEIRLQQVQGEIASEQQRAELLMIQRENQRVAALGTGEAEAQRVAAFLAGLGDGMTLAQRIALFNTLRKGETLKALSEGDARLYFTPADVDLKIEG